MLKDNLTFAKRKRGSRKEISFEGTYTPEILLEEGESPIDK
jgi:hypothetical protein